MNRALAVAAASLVLHACSPVPDTYLPDGGRPNRGCADGKKTYALKVLDYNGKPVAGATVTAVNVPMNKTLTGTTDGNGVSLAVTEELGPGDVEITAKEGTRVSEPIVTQWVCGVCDCLATPSAGTVTIK